MASSPEHQEAVVRLITQHQRDIYIFALGRLHASDAAEEVLQETNVVLWRKLDQFQLGTRFLAWACSIAELEVRKYLARTQRQLPVLSDVLQDDLAAEMLAAVEETDRTQRALHGCIDQLSADDRQLLEQRYSLDSSVKGIAVASGRSADAIYRAMRRIHGALLSCIQRKLASEA